MWWFGQFSATGLADPMGAPAAIALDRSDDGTEHIAELSRISKAYRHLHENR